MVRVNGIWKKRVNTNCSSQGCYSSCICKKTNLASTVLENYAEQRPAQLQVALKENVNVMALDYTAATQDTHRSGKAGKDVILLSIHFSDHNYLEHFEFFSEQAAPIFMLSLFLRKVVRVPHFYNNNRKNQSSSFLSNCMVPTICSPLLFTEYHSLRTGVIPS